MLFAPRTRAERERTPSLVDVTLDPAQRAAIDLPRGRALLVLGEAGHGKTTVLLHRVARLWRASRRAAIVVPTEGLVRLVTPMMRKLGVDVQVLTFDQFAAAQARHFFRRLPRESEETPPLVSHLKRSPSLQRALELVRLSEVTRGRSRAYAKRDDLIHVFGERTIVESVAREAGLPVHAVAQTLDRTRVQFDETTERAWRHVTDRKRLVAVDRRKLDDGTATGHASTIDVEDYAVLFEIDRLRAAAVGEEPRAPRAFDLVAIDEAQELAPIELALLGRSVAPGGSLVVAGDADQHTDDATTFRGWESVMSDLGATDHATSRLAIGYRCPPEVVVAARAVRDGSCANVDVHRFDDENALASELRTSIETLLRRDRRASICIVCRRPATARRLGDKLGVRVVWDGRFLPRGAHVAVVDEVKGLELDYVVVPDASKTEWPDDAASRRAMYVAITRARHQAVFACVNVPSPLLVADPTVAAADPSLVPPSAK
jgi:DNA helicase-2/ATP-dependent DNA helicase PcrA